MSAQPVESGAYPRWSAGLTRQGLGNYTIEDVLSLPEDAPRVELRDGVMIVVPSPTLDHQDIEFLLRRWLWERVPRELRVTGSVGVAVDAVNTLEPDIMIIRREANGASHYLMPDQVVLVVEVVSPSTKKRDRLEKPADYADAGIPFFWRIEQNPVHVFAYELAPGATYKLVADSDTELVLERPFAIRLPIGDITP